MSRFCQSCSHAGDRGAPRPRLLQLELTTKGNGGESSREWATPVPSLISWFRMLRNRENQVDFGRIFRPGENLGGIFCCINASSIGSTGSQSWLTLRVTTICRTGTSVSVSTIRRSFFKAKAFGAICRAAAKSGSSPIIIGRAAEEASRTRVAPNY